MKKKGFTLIELLVVMGLLGLLVLTGALLVPSQLKKARDVRRKADLGRIKVALYDHYFDHDCFPEELPGCGENFGVEGEPYLNNFPCDFNGQPYVYVTRKGGGECKQWFRIFANLENVADPVIDQIHCRTGCGPSKTECLYNYGITSTNTQIYRNCSDFWVCNPGGQCERFEDPWMSGCPAQYGTEEACEASCDKHDPATHCQDASGKQKPQE